MATFPQTCRKKVVFFSGCLFVYLSSWTPGNPGLSLRFIFKAEAAGLQLSCRARLDQKSSRQPQKKLQRATRQQQRSRRAAALSGCCWKVKRWFTELQTKSRNENTCWLSNLQDLKTNWITGIHLLLEKLPPSLPQISLFGCLQPKATQLSSTHHETMSTSWVGSLLRQLAAASVSH